jgi:hypothetical protein
MRQTALQGFRNGGRAPYGYRLEPSPHPVAARAKAGETKHDSGHVRPPAPWQTFRFGGGL